MCSVYRDTPLILLPNASRVHRHSQRFIEARGGKHLRFKKGYKNVIDKAIELNDQVRISIPMLTEVGCIYPATHGKSRDFMLSPWVVTVYSATSRLVQRWLPI